MEDHDLTGKTALITGGTGRIGAKTGPMRTSPPRLRSTCQAQRRIARRPPRSRRRDLERADLRRA